MIVKSFYLEMEEGKQQSRRWIETRFLTRQGTEWYGYSYAWNDEQTEGTLIEASRVPGAEPGRTSRGITVSPGFVGNVPISVAEAVDTPKIPNSRPAAASMHNDL